VQGFHSVLPVARRSFGSEGTEDKVKGWLVGVQVSTPAATRELWTTSRNCNGPRIEADCCGVGQPRSSGVV